MSSSIFKEKIKYEGEKTIFEAKTVYQGFSKITRILLIILILSLIPAYYISKAISFRLTYKTTEKYKLTARQTTLFASPLTLGEVKIFNLGQGLYSAYGRVVNPNLDIAVSTSDYEVTFNGQNGEVIGTVKGKFSVAPNGDYIVIVPRFESQTPPSSARLSVVSPKFIRRLEVPQVNLQSTTPRQSIQSDPANFALEGSIYNNSPFSLSQVEIQFIFKNESGNIIMVSSRTENSLKPYERRAYKHLMPESLGYSSPEVEVVTYTDVYDYENIRTQVGF